MAKADALRIIRENIEKHNRGEDARVLDLGNCGLRKFPEEALECVWVEELILSGKWHEYDSKTQKWEDKSSQNEGKVNGISLLPPTLSKLQLLQKLVIESTQVADLSPLAGLTNLQLLHCRLTQVTDLFPLVALTNLQQLDCSYTGVANLSPLEALTNLQILFCSNTQVANLSPLAALTNLQHLDCSNTYVVDLSSLVALTNLQILDCSDTYVADLSPLAALTNLQILFCSNAVVSDLSPLKYLINLQQLNISGEGFTSDGRVSDLSPLADLVNLKKLDCSANQVIDLQPLMSLTNLERLNISGGIFTENGKINNLFALSELPNLRQLDCSRTHVSDISPIAGFIEKGINIIIHPMDEQILNGFNYFDFSDCPLTTPPIEIVKQGNEAILRYFEERKKGQLIKVREAKLLIVGQGRSGKSSLRTKLLDRTAPLPEPDDTTRGIEISRLEVNMPITGEPLRINIWDFGGQNIQHFAHQFFLTANSLYALVTNERIQDHAHLSYWLQIIEMLGKKSPVMLIQNKDGGHCSALPREAAIRARFGNVHNRIFQTDFLHAATEPEFTDLYKEIVHRASQLPHIEREYLASFAQLRVKLETLADSEKHYLRREEYFDLMPDLSPELMIDYANALTFLGVCQYFPDDVWLREYVFLRPKWIIDALFHLLLHPSLDATQGFFTENDTTHIWKTKEYNGMHGLLVRMMQEFELCYPIEGKSHAFIIPQRLPSENKTYGWSEIEDIPVQYQYKFLPKGILTRLICRLHERIETLQGSSRQHVWSDAVIFSLPDGRGRVFVREVYEAHHLELRAAGEKGSEILNEVIRKLDDINNDAKYENLQWEKLVPCPCPVCLANPEERFFHPFEILVKRLEKGKTTNPCGKSGDDIEIEEIFGKSGVKFPKLGRSSQLDLFSWERQAAPRSHRPTPAQPAPLRIFISYSQHDRDNYLIPMTRYLKPLMIGGLLETWDDSQILPGEEWDEKIKSEIEKADVIFLLVSTHSLNTDYIWNVEIEAAMRRHEAGTARVIPIILSKCLWTEKDREGNYIFPPARLNAFPSKGKPINKWADVNDAWDAVAEGVKAVLKGMR